MIRLTAKLEVVERGCCVDFDSECSRCKWTYNTESLKFSKDGNWELVSGAKTEHRNRLLSSVSLLAKRRAFPRWRIPCRKPGKTIETPQQIIAVSVPRGYDPADINHRCARPPPAQSALLCAYIIMTGQDESATKPEWWLGWEMMKRGK